MNASNSMANVNTLHKEEHSSADVNEDSGIGNMNVDDNSMSRDAEPRNASQKLIHTCRKGDLNCVRSLVESESIDVKNYEDEEHNDTPLHWASYYGHLNVVKYLVEECECDVKMKNIFGNTPLHRAAEGKQGSEGIVEYLIKEMGCDPMSKGQYHRTPLHKACKKGKLDVIKFLMADQKSDYQYRESKHGYTPLDLAAQHGTLEVVQYMIELHNTASGGNAERYTPLHYAAYGGKLYIVKYLVEKREFDAPR